MGSVIPSELRFTRTERVTMGQPAADALLDQAQAMNCRKVFLIASSTLREKTEEISKIEKALGSRHAGTFSGIAPHAPRADE